MIDLIIWSMDRACQLDALLRSLDRYAEDVFNPWIVYKTSNQDFNDGYKQCAFKRKAFFACENIKNTTFERLTKLGLSEGKADWVAFSTDDTILHKFVDKNTLQEALPTLTNQAFSFRLGFNTIIQDCHRGTVQPPLNQYVQHKGWISWDINKYNPHDNYGYPFGLDMHCFRRELIQEIFKEIEFKSTNELESILTTQYRYKIDELRSFDNSVSVNIPVNTVTNVTRAGEKYPSSKDELNKRFLDGERIDLDDIEKTEFKGCHQENSYKFVR